jgi:MSHA biogenesis protein MshQ
MTEAVDVASQTPNNANGISMEMNYEVRASAGATGTRQATASTSADSGATQSVALKAAPLICYTDDFNRANGSPGSDWVVSNTSGTFGNPVIFNNRLRLTDASANVATMATLQRLFPGSGNRIEVDFDHFAYGYAGCAADGIALTLSDSGVTAVPGGYGGSLGYAQRTGINGFAGGWLGVGIDEYGNFSNPTEGRNGGPGFRVDSVAVRGSGSGTTGYAYHAGTAANLVPQVDNNGAAVPPHHYRIIVDHSNGVNAMVSVERDTGAGYVTLVAPYDAKAQAGQATVPTGWLMSYTGSTGGCNNIHEIDSLQVCATSQTSMTGIHHFDITVGASASTCAPQSITIVARDISNNILTGYTGTVQVTTSTAHGDWSIVSAGGTLTNGTADDGVATYTFVAGDNGTITLGFTNTHADDLTFNVTDVTVPSSSTTSSATSFRDSAFVITPDTIQIAGRDQNTTVTLYTRVGGSCTPDTNYTGARNLDTWLALDPSHPAGATVPTIGALTLPTSAPASNPASNNLVLTFTAGVASFALSTTDVGRYVLNIRDDTRTYATAVDLGGASSSITTRPWLHVAVPGNTGNNAATGSIFTSAGTDFTATVRGVLWQAADDANNDGVPDSGANLADNTATPRFAWDTVLSPTTPFTPATPSDTPAGTGTAGTLTRGAGGSTVAQASFSSGSATVTDWRYSEVGSFTLRATASNYLNSGISALTDNNVVGRFTPAYFDVTRVHGCPAGADPLLFTYSGQLFTVTATARAANSGAVTANYDGTLGFAKDTTISDAGVTTNFTPNNNTTSNNVLGAGSFVNGARTQSTVTYTFPAKETALATLTLRAIDTDNVSSAGHTEEQTQIRSGRVRLYNAYGSELVTLSMPMRAEYYEDTTVSAPATNPPVTGWVTNSADTCTSLSLPNLDLQNAVHDPAQGVATINIKTGPNIPSTVTVVSPTVGTGELSFSAPGAGGDGYADARMDLSARSWLHFDWNGTGNTDPTGRATFGLYRGSPKHIYLRQRYN